MSNELNQEAFEMAIKGRGYSVERYAGHYAQTDTNHMYQGWLAAITALAALPQQQAAIDEFICDDVKKYGSPIPTEVTQEILNNFPKVYTQPAIDDAVEIVSKALEINLHKQTKRFNEYGHTTSHWQHINCNELAKEALQASGLLDRIAELETKNRELEKKLYDIEVPF